MSRRIVVVGSLNADFVVSVTRLPAAGETIVGNHFAVWPGGKGANQAYAAARLGATVSMVGQVGNDSHGAWLRQHLATGGVDVSHVGTDEAVSSGVALITLEAGGQNRIIIVPGANGTFSPDRLATSATLFTSDNIVLLQLEVPLPTVLAAARKAREAGAVVMLDPAPAQELPAELLHAADYITPNETEIAALTGGSVVIDLADARRRAGELRARGARRVIVKLGGRGALLVGEHAEHFWPALPVTVVDTTAAGDTFNAAYATALAEGQSDADAGRLATAAAAWSVARPGAQPSMPCRADVAALLEGSSR